MAERATAAEHGDITVLLARAGQPGNEDALGKVFSLLHQELKVLARSRLNGASPATLSPTALVNELYLKFVDSAQLALASRTHFFATAARAMRQIITDTARAALAGKRGGDLIMVTLSEQEFGDDQQTLIALDEALHDLERIDPALRELVELRFYAGLEMGEISALCGRSVRSLHRDWERARALLNAMLLA